MPAQYQITRVVPSKTSGAPGDYVSINVYARNMGDVNPGSSWFGLFRDGELYDQGFGSGIPVGGVEYFVHSFGYRIEGTHSFYVEIGPTRTEVHDRSATFTISEVAPPPPTPPDWAAALTTTPLFFVLGIIAVNEVSRLAVLPK